MELIQSEPFLRFADRMRFVFQRGPSKTYDCHMLYTLHGQADVEMEGITPKIQPIRGGTDGANLSFMGLPCPNIFAGGHNFHGKMEYVPLESMEKASKVILNIIGLYAE